MYYPNGEGAMGNLLHMIWVILAAILAGVSMVKVRPARPAGKPDDHGTLRGDVSSAVPDGESDAAAVAGSEVAAAAVAESQDVAESGGEAGPGEAEEPVEQPLPSGPAPI